MPCGTEFIITKTYVRLFYQRRYADAYYYTKMVLHAAVQGRSFFPSGAEIGSSTTDKQRKTADATTVWRCNWCYQERESIGYE